MSRLIVLVEDNHLHSSDTARTLEAALEDVELYEVGSENEFRLQLQDFRMRPPDLFILDVMLRWAWPPSPNMPAPPPDVAAGGYARAGIRCVRLLAADENLRDIPVVLYTGFGLHDLAQDIRRMPAGITLRVVRKAGGLAGLIPVVRESLAGA